MGRKGLAIEKYQEFAQEHQLALLGAADKVVLKSRWRCLQCGRIIERSLSAMRRRPVCTCRTRKALHPADYHNLAAELGLIWEGPFPQRSTYLTNWRRSDGTLITHSYKQLKWGLTDVS